MFSTELLAIVVANVLFAAPATSPAAGVAVQARTGEPLPVADWLPRAVRTEPRERRKKRGFGPPPPGYIRIIGEPVPDWQPGQSGPALRDAPSWTLLGPRPIQFEYWSGTDNATGRVVSVAPHPTDANTVYIASASGGVWKTTDGGANWTPLTDELAVLNHGAVALDPSNPNTVYVGTGEYTTYSTGDGLFRSTDGGANWTKIATTAQVGNRCSEIVVDPSNALLIHVTGAGGYRRSTDGGTNWTTPLAGDCSDVALKPGTPSTVYVGKHSDGVYRSLDSGATFTKLTTGLPSGGDRIILAVSPHNANLVLAAFATGGSLLGLYRSTDSGGTWSQVTGTPNFPSPQAWYDMFVGISPTNSSHYFGGGVFPDYAVAGIIRSTNGGTSWTEIVRGTLGGSAQVHPDMHAIAFGPTGIVWVGCDGGVWKSSNNGASWTNCNATLSLTQNYNIAIHPTDPNQAMGGTQDNGTVGRYDATLNWPQIVSGDGGFLAFDQSNPDLIYTTYVYLTIFRIDYGTGFWDEITGPWGSDSVNFIAPLVMDPNDSRILLGGTNRVWRTTNADTAATWTAISTNTVSGGGTLNAIAVATGNSAVIYTGSSTGKVYVTTNTGGSWNNRSTGLPTGEISDIFIDPADSNVAYVSFYNTSGGRLYQTTNAGTSWTNRTGALPSGVSITALEVDWRFHPPYLYTGSGAGVYESADHGTTWVKDGADLPNVNIGDLVIDYDNLTITAGTYGRGAWRKGLPVLKGDMNCDGALDSFDIAPFIVALVSIESYQAAYPDCDPYLGDMNDDGAIDSFDIGLFAAALTG